MTKTDFTALANMLRNTRPEDFGGDSYPVRLEQWERDRDALADLCARSNPAFKRGRWLDYIAGKCGPSGGAVKR